ncbi:hypothetical protein ACQ86N_38010 [Puia sp. P3]|uniref:hypothetical protein n=1 Tax=Puia sp. P3 TaxID=3423952 RepID=UPI003D66BD30
MNQSVRLLCGAALVALPFAACKKDHYNPPPPRTIQYQLYTDQDFSTDQHTITFRLTIHGRNNVVFDSALAPMLIRDVPNKAHQLVFQKLVPPGFDKDTLVVGFVYDIKDVGESSVPRTPAPPASA